MPDAGHTETFVRTRLAPTPSGYLHVGNILSFALTAALARRSGARIFLRIDDLDRERVRKEYVQDIFDTLSFLGIPWDEGPKDPGEFERTYAQRHRFQLYRSALDDLRANGLVFACTCSRAELIPSAGGLVYPGTCRHRGLDLDTPGASWRLRTDPQKTVTVQTLSGTVTELLPPSMQDFIVRKKDGWPSYQLASVIDDLHYGTDLIVRGADLWPSTLAQHCLAEALPRPDFSRIHFYHHPLLTGIDGLKLSKSAGDTSIHRLRLQGHSPEHIYKRIARHAGLPTPISNWQELASALMYKLCI